ncbi:cytochrome P450 [Pluteus cervinus]|uniref:Cytochrome P450 n=1 Tax=Pluteus cervinus TaxID=181527 RepID=A0ACD3AAB4_9AGAR|nr:cytochrome P450 [Pluteus cervinus]
MVDFYTLSVSVVGVLLAVVAIDQFYQQYSHRWTNEPPFLPYRIPIVGHALAFNKDLFAVFRRAQHHFSDSRPYSLMLFGHRVYVFTHNRDVSVVYRKSKELPFTPLIENHAGHAWGISPHGMKRLSAIDESGDSLFRNAHPFYRDALKPGPQLDLVTIQFLSYLQDALDQFDRDQTTVTERLFYNWSTTMLGKSSTNAMMGPSLLKNSPRFLRDAFEVDKGFFYFVNKVPRMFAKKQYAARDRVLDALEKYFSDPQVIAESAPMIRDREVQLREKGLTTRDIGAYSFSAYVALVTNAKTITYNLLRHIFKRPQYLARIREEIVPAFRSGRDILTLEQVSIVLNQCPVLKAFYHETLRMHASASSNRVVVEEANIGGFTLKKGHNVICPSYLQHQAPEYFGEEPPPKLFDPERYLQPVLKEKGKPANSSMIRAFGGGVSLCSGRHFAGNEVLSLAATVVWRYDIEFVRGDWVKMTPRFV